MHTHIFTCKHPHCRERKMHFQASTRQPGQARVGGESRREGETTSPWECSCTPRSETLHRDPLSGRPSCPARLPAFTTPSPSAQRKVPGTPKFTPKFTPTHMSTQSVHSTRAKRRDDSCHKLCPPLFALPFFFPMHGGPVTPRNLCIHVCVCECCHRLRVCVCLRSRASSYE